MVRRRGLVKSSRRLLQSYVCFGGLRFGNAGMEMCAPKSLPGLERGAVARGYEGGGETRDL